MLIGLYVLREALAYRGLTGSLVGASYAGFLVTLWVLSGQHLGDLAVFMRLSLELATAYSDAMSESGPWVEVVVYLFGSVALLMAVVGFNRTRPLRVSAFHLLAFTMLLFLGFKQAF